MCVALCAKADESGERVAQGPYLALAGGAWTIDLIGLTDGQPRPHGHAGGEAEVGWLWGEAWATSASFRWGGSWFDFDAFASLPYGHLREQTWMVRLVVDRRFPGARGRSVWFGAGFLYGEAHSDVNTSVFTRDQPPNFFAGGLMRVGAGFPLAGPVELYGELEQSLFRARGGDPDFQEEYRWLGRSLAGHVGLRLAAARPRGD
jgi:hypothetical protein